MRFYMLDDADRAAIDELRDRLRDSIVNGDVEAYAACFAEGAVLMHPDTPQVKGRAAIAEYAEAMFDTVSVPRLDLTPVSLFGEGKYAFEVGVQECQIEPALPGFKRDRQHLHVYERAEDGTWFLAAAMSGNQ